MAKRKTVFCCSDCGHKARTWVGKCPACGAWDTLVEEMDIPEDRRAGRIGTDHRTPTGTGRPVPIREVRAEDAIRLATGVSELDRILGGGLVPGAAILIGGEPGVGKSTLLLQVARWIATAGMPVLYVTAEESAVQIRLRATRLDALTDNLYVFAENDLDLILAQAPETGCMILDSIQMVFWRELGSAPGSVGQVRECAAALIAQAKRRGIPLFLVGHVTKDGAIAGPKVLEHMVDVVLSFEGDRFHAARILRAVKNRFGAVNEIGVFEMAAEGLVPVPDPSALFLSGRSEHAPGTVVSATLEGSRPFLVEVQALVAAGYPGNARRQVSGADRGRVNMLLAVLETHAGLALYDKDVFLNVVGGATLDEPGSDLAQAIAIASSLREQAVAPDLLAVGEVGLGGEIRPVAQLEARLAEGARLGFRGAMVPASSKVRSEGLTLYPVNRMEEAIQLALPR